jgi:hypothetical protein
MGQTLGAPLGRNPSARPGCQQVSQGHQPAAVIEQTPGPEPDDPRLRGSARLAGPPSP